MASVTVSDEVRTKLVTAGSREVEVFDTAGQRIGVIVVDQPEPTLAELEADLLAPGARYTTAEVLEHCRARAGQ